MRMHTHRHEKRRGVGVLPLMVLLGALSLTGHASAIDTTWLQDSASEPARSLPSARTAPPAADSTAAQASREAPGDDHISDYKPYVLALAGALVMAYIGLRRPPE